MVTEVMKSDDHDCVLVGKYENPDSVNKKQRHHFANKGPYNQGYGLSSSHVQMRELGHKEGRAPKN